MKYAKKMRLVEIGDDISQPPDEQPYLSQPSDDKFTAPRTLSMLDNSMNSILNRSDIDDGEKWKLYHQILQRYLNHMRTTQKSNMEQTPHNIQLVSDSPGNHTPDAFNKELSDHNITGIFPIRDSIENIALPHVRQFFEQARQKDVNQLSPVLPMTSDNSMISLDASPRTPSPQQQQQQLRRGTKRNAGNNVTAIHPNKIVATQPEVQPRQLYRNRQQTESRAEFYWMPTKAK